MFDKLHADSIEEAAKKIYGAIFEPEGAVPHVDAELPSACMAQTTNGLRIALELVNVITGIKSGTKGLQVDPDGSATARVLSQVWGVIKYVSGDEPASLGLHPAVYFWGLTGNHRPSMFLAVIAFVQELIQKDELVTFTLHRARLEEFLVGKEKVGQQILSRYGGWKRSLEPIKHLLRLILDGHVAGKSDAEILDAIKNLSGNSDTHESVKGDAWKETRSAARIKASLSGAPRCAICHARLLLSHASDDHVQRRTDGGHSGAGNAQLTHHYCNHGFKEHFAQRQKAIPVIAAQS